MVGVESSTLGGPHIINRLRTVKFLNPALDTLADIEAQRTFAPPPPASSSVEGAGGLDVSTVNSEIFDGRFSVSHESLRG